MIISYIDGRKAVIKDSIGRSILKDISYAVKNSTETYASIAIILQTISDYLQPDDVFSINRLDDLAIHRGFINKPEM